MTLRVRSAATDADPAGHDTAGAHLGARQERAESARTHLRCCVAHQDTEPRVRTRT